MQEPKNHKDCWDKIEILGKVTGAVLVPVVAAAALYWWNSERTRQQTAAALTPLAVTILTTGPTDEDSVALREWAISVMNSPSNPPALTQDVAEGLGAIGLEIFELPANIAEPCLKPSEFLAEDLYEDGLNWEVIVGQVGNELITCERKRQVAVDAYNRMAEVLSK